MDKVKKALDGDSQAKAELKDKYPDGFLESEKMARKCPSLYPETEEDDLEKL